MELLPKLTLKDYIHYAIALLYVAVSGIIAYFALQQVRTVVRSTCALVRCRRSGIRLAEILTWVVLGVAFAIYILAIEPLYTKGVTKARTTRAQGRAIPNDVAQNSLKRWFWNHDLYLTTKSFLKAIWIPMAVLVVAYLVNEILIRLVLG